jgi:hypothetical protein
VAHPCPVGSHRHDDRRGASAVRSRGGRITRSCPLGTRFFGGRRPLPTAPGAPAPQTWGATTAAAVGGSCKLDELHDQAVKLEQVCTWVHDRGLEADCPGPPVLCRWLIGVTGRGVHSPVRTVACVHASPLGVRSPGCRAASLGALEQARGRTKVRGRIRPALSGLLLANRTPACQ